jgi:hypothetical protein
LIGHCRIISLKPFTGLTLNINTFENLCPCGFYANTQMADVLKN